MRFTSKSVSAPVKVGIYFINFSSESKLAQDIFEALFCYLRTCFSLNGLKLEKRRAVVFQVTFRNPLPILTIRTSLQLPTASLVLCFSMVCIKWFHLAVCILQTYNAFLDHFTSSCIKTKDAS